MIVDADTEYKIFNKARTRHALLDGYISQLDTMAGYTIAHKVVPQIFVPLQLVKLLGSFITIIHKI